MINETDLNAIDQLTDTQLSADFRLFLKHRPFFVALEDAGVFNTRNGQVLLNFDHRGTITKFTVTTSFNLSKGKFDTLI